MPPDVSALNKEIDTLLKDAKAISDETWAKSLAMSVEQGKEYEGKCKQAETLQAQVDQIKADRVTKIEEHRNQLANQPVTPTIDAGQKDTGGPVGYISAGTAFVESDAYQTFLEAGRPQSGSHKFEFPGYFGADRFIGLDQKSAQARIESKAVPTIGTSPAVIQPGRIAEVVRVTEIDRLVMRDLVSVLPTTSNAVEFVRITSDQPTAATTVAESAAKPESTVALDAVTQPVRTLAVWMPVTEQQLQDIPQIRGIVDSFLRFDIARLEEYQIIWGGGTGQDLLGIMSTSGVTAMTRTPVIGAGTTVTLLDKIFAAGTDIRVNNLEANGVGIHPIDWEGIALSKGSDNHYLAQVFPDDEGRLRAWGMRVVVTPAMTAYRSANTTDQRVVIVGDYARGAILWDRQQATVEVGFINNQFVLNQRTIRAEERVAFGVVRPKAFKYIETVAAVL